MGNEYYFWSKEKEDVFQALQTSPLGLSSAVALSRKTPPGKGKSVFEKRMLLFFSQFKNPLTLLLIFALLLSSIIGEFGDSAIIFSILFISALLSFLQESKANEAVEKLRSLLRSKAMVKRDGKAIEISMDEVVPGDIVLLIAGDIVPADALIAESEDLYVNESVLTGESYPAEKKHGKTPEDTPINGRKNVVFRGTSVISGTAIVVAVLTGKESELGKIDAGLGLTKEETAFEKGIRQFGFMIMKVAFSLAGIIIIVNIWSGKNPLDSILFALVLSIGFAPEMLPAIVSITLSAGAKRLSQRKVLVKRLSSIQNLGAIDILCCDKTGTLTEGIIKVHSYLSPDGKDNPLIKQYAYLNALFESGYPNPMDLAIREQAKADISGYEKFDEVPYDFIRKRLSIVVAHNKRHIMITKGALSSITEVCDQVLLSDGIISPIGTYSSQIRDLFEDSSRKGFRTIGICFKDVTDDPVITKDDESGMIFCGLILLYDPPKKDIAEVIQQLRIKQVELKIITGDNPLVAENIARLIGIGSPGIISGKEFQDMNDEALEARVEEISIFSEIVPAEKERIVRALQKKGHVVGYLGDGINDAMALKTADVGITVNNAVDTAKESADMILLEKELDVLNDGITEGRKTYLNTLKYIFITISANFGNMFSMAGASILLPFLPLLPSQVLLTNFLTDLPALTISSDRVDEELLQKPRKWDVRLIRNFMVVFGLESSLFDFMTFGILILYFHASTETFRTAWFIESVISEILILLVIRSRRLFFKSRIGRLLLISSVIVIIFVMVMPFIPIFSTLGFVPLPPDIMFIICSIALIYAIVGEISKKILFRKMNY